MPPVYIPNAYSKKLFSNDENVVVNENFLDIAETGDYCFAETTVPTKPVVQTSFSLKDVPAFSGDPYIVVNENQPYFLEGEKVAVSFETYSALDNLGRCGTAYACIGQNIMPTEKRGEIGSVKPSGWQSIKYDNVDGKYLYNRCHLIGYQLSGENANTQNLITSTRYLNIDGMLPFENMTADYVKATKLRLDGLSPVEFRTNVT